MKFLSTFKITKGFDSWLKMYKEIEPDLDQLGIKILWAGTNSEETKVFDELSKRYSSRKGGYSRVLKAGFRTGDDAPMAVIELIDRNPEARNVDKPKKTDTKNKTKEVKSESRVASK